LLKQNRLDEAEGRFKAILEISEINAYALSGLGDIARKINDYTKALEYYTKCLNEHPDNNYALFGLADGYRGINEYNKAIDIWLNCLSRDEYNISIITSIADAYCKLTDFKKAEEYYKKALDLDADDERSQRGLGFLYFDSKMYEETINYWEFA
jgi:tetratricopeptide (TPR) repeat protein